MSKDIIHFPWTQGSEFSACFSEQRNSLEVTNIRKKVTCKRCKNTKMFRKGIK